MPNSIKRFRYIEKETSDFWPSSNAKGILCAIDSNWLVQESPGLNRDYFGDIRLFSEMKVCSYKVTVQTLYCKPGEEKLDDNFLYTATFFKNGNNNRLLLFARKFTGTQAISKNYFKRIKYRNAEKF